VTEETPTTPDVTTFVTSPLFGPTTATVRVPVTTREATIPVRTPEAPVTVSTTSIPTTPLTDQVEAPTTTDDVDSESNQSVPPNMLESTTVSFLFFL